MNYSRKHIINRHLKPIVDEAGIKLYPVYIQVVYKRKNYWFKSVIETYYANFDTIEEEDRQIMKAELELLDAILEYEFALKGEKFQLAGFANRFHHYRLPVIEIGESYLMSKLEALLSKSYKEFIEVLNYKYLPGRFETLMRAAVLLYPEIKDDEKFKKLLIAQKFWEEYRKTFPARRIGELKRPSVFEWITEEHFSAIRQILKYSEGNLDANAFELLADFDKHIRQVSVGM